MVPRISGGSLQEHRELVQHRVFEAFAGLLAERSFEAVTMAALAERAGLTRTAIYHHFRDKEAVVVAFASHETARYVDRLRARLDETSDPVHRLRTYVRHHLAAGEEFHLGLGPHVYAVLSPEAREAIRDHVVAVEEVLRGLLRSGVEAGVFSVDDLEGTTALVHACLSPRHLPPGTVESFVLRAVGAAG